MFGVVRIGLGGWILLLPTIEKAGFSTLALVLAALLVVSGAIGIAFAPDTRGRDLEETETADVHAHHRSLERASRITLGARRWRAAPTGIRDGDGAIA